MPQGRCNLNKGKPETTGQSSWVGSGAALLSSKPPLETEVRHGRDPLSNTRIDKNNRNTDKLKDHSIVLKPVPANWKSLTRDTVDGVARDIWYTPASHQKIEAAEDREKGECRLCGFQNKESRVVRRYIRQHYWRFWCRCQKSSSSFFIIYNHQQRERDLENHPCVVYQVDQESFPDFCRYIGWENYSPTLFGTCLPVKDGKGWVTNRKVGQKRKRPTQPEKAGSPDPEITQTKRAGLPNMTIRIDNCQAKGDKEGPGRSFLQEYTIPKKARRVSARQEESSPPTPAPEEDLGKTKEVEPVLEVYASTADKEGIETDSDTKIHIPASRSAEPRRNDRRESYLRRAEREEREYQRYSWLARESQQEVQRLKSRAR